MVSGLAPRVICVGQNARESISPRLGRGNGYPDRLRSVCLTQYHAAVRAARLSPVRSGGATGADRGSAARRLTKCAAARPLFALRAGRMAASGITRRDASRRRRLLCARADGSLPKWWGPAGGNDFGGNPQEGGSCIRPVPRGSLSEFDRSVCLTQYHAAECAQITLPLTTTIGYDS